VKVIVSNTNNTIKIYTEIHGFKLALRADNDYAVVLAQGLKIKLNPMQRGISECINIKTTIF
jgi:hypothetical protein